MKKGKLLAMILVGTLLSGVSGSFAMANVNDLQSESIIEQSIGNPIIETAINKSSMTASATSFQAGEDASKAIDGNINTMWHTKWDGSDVLPQSISVNLGNSYELSALKITPRQSGDNGKIQEYNIYADGVLVKSGKLNTVNSGNFIRFDKPINASEIKIEATKAAGGFVSIGELDFYQKIGESQKLFDSNNVKITNGNGPNLNTYLDNARDLDNGTIISRFELKGSGIQSILGISNNTQASHHFNLWTDGSRLGYEVRNAAGNTNGTVNVALNKGINTIAFKVEKNVGYSLYLNGERVKFDASSNTKFLKDIPNLNTIDIGKTDRTQGANEYLFTGNVDFLDFYADAISDEYITQKTGQTKAIDLPLPDGAYLSETQEIFTSGDLNSSKFRIPSIVTTSKGTTIAATDVRNNHAGDSPANIDAGIRISKDGGKTWGEHKRVIDYPGYASVIDSSMLEDKEAGKVFLFITAFPENYGFPNTQQGTGFEVFEDELCMLLFDGAGTNGQKGQGNKYYIKPDGNVYAADGTQTNYSVDAKNDLYENGTKVSNIFLPAAPIKAYGTAYLTVIESSDEGESWSDPRIISGGLKKDWMKFIGTGPGVGIQIENGDKAGRLVFPLYYTNSNNFQSSAVMYSDDHGKTWTLGESPNDSRDGHAQDSDTISSGNQLTEAQVIQMPDGQLKMFMRNTGSYVRIATSLDGGETWESDVYEDRNLIEPYCQLSVINYDGLIDGKPAVIFANPNASNRSNGTVRIGLIEENGVHPNGETKYNFNWKYSQSVVPGAFAYSSLTQLPNNNIGLYYEGPGSDSMNFVEMNLDFVKADLIAQAPEAKLTSFEMISNNDNYVGGDNIELKVQFDQAVSMFGDRGFVGTIGDKEIDLNIKSFDNARTLVLEGALPQDIANGDYPIQIKSKQNLDIVNVIGKKSDLTNNIDTNLSIKVGEVIEEGDIVVSKVSGLECTDIEANSLNLTWKAPESLVGLVEYEVYKDGKRIASLTNRENQFKVEDLKTNTIYSFKVITKYSNGESSKPVSINQRTSK